MKNKKTSLLYIYRGGCLMPLENISKLKSRFYSFLFRLGKRDFGQVYVLNNEIEEPSLAAFKAGITAGRVYD